MIGDWLWDLVGSAPSPLPSPPMGAGGKEGVVAMIGDWLWDLVERCPLTPSLSPDGGEGESGRSGEDR